KEVHIDWDKYFKDCPEAVWIFRIQDTESNAQLAEYQFMGTKQNVKKHSSVMYTQLWNQRKQETGEKKQRMYVTEPFLYWVPIKLALECGDIALCKHVRGLDENKYSPVKKIPVPNYN
ncbi:MAG: hypothetical protein WCO84_09015, partial [bacterium]